MTECPWEANRDCANQERSNSVHPHRSAIVDDDSSWMRIRRGRNSTLCTHGNGDVSGQIRSLWNNFSGPRFQSGKRWSGINGNHRKWFVSNSCTTRNHRRPLSRDDQRAGIRSAGIRGINDERQVIVHGFPDIRESSRGNNHPDIRRLRSKRYCSGEKIEG